MVQMSLPSELDKAQLKFELRKMYQEIGYTAAVVVLVEMVIGAELLSEVIVEERKKEYND